MVDIDLENIEKMLFYITVWQNVFDSSQKFIGRQMIKLCMTQEK